MAYTECAVMDNPVRCAPALQHMYTAMSCNKGASCRLRFAPCGLYPHFPSLPIRFLPLGMVVD